jgi:non-specific serine/threonine protein kinase
MDNPVSRRQAARRDASRRATPRIWRFGNAVFDERMLELQVDGQIVALERKHIAILNFFLENPGEVLFKDRLAAAIWPGRAVTDSNLTKCIAVLRHALGDHAQSMIKTLHGFGYRLAVPVRVEPATPAYLPRDPAGPAEMRPR